MKKELLYKDMAKYYDLIYHWKDYKKEAYRVKALIKKYKKSPGNLLLDVGCGTGHHLKFFIRDFECTGIDSNKEMLEIAMKNVGNALLKPGDMTKFNLGKKFDVVLCLFSSIGYVKTYKNLQKTVKNFSFHLKEGGVLIIEPWFEKRQFNSGMPGMTNYDSKNLKIARLNTSKIRGNTSILEMHYLVAEKGKDIKHFSDVHELGLFEKDRTLELMKKHGLQSIFLKNGLMKDRGLFIGVKK